MVSKSMTDTELKIVELVRDYQEIHELIHQERIDYRTSDHWLDATIDSCIYSMNCAISERMRVEELEEQRNKLKTELLQNISDMLGNTEPTRLQRELLKNIKCIIREL